MPRQIKVLEEKGDTGPKVVSCICRSLSLPFSDLWSRCCSVWLYSSRIFDRSILLWWNLFKIEQSNCTLWELFGILIPWYLRAFSIVIPSHTLKVKACHSTRIVGVLDALKANAHLVALDPKPAWIADTNLTASFDLLLRWFSMYLILVLCTWHSQPFQVGRLRREPDNPLAQDIVGIHHPHQKETRRHADQLRPRRRPNSLGLHTVVPVRFLWCAGLVEVAL